MERAEIIRDKGTNRQRFFRGEVDKYTWVDVGSSYVPSELCSAFLYAQLEEMEKISSRRKEIYEFYRTSLEPLEAEGLLRLPVIPRECQSNYHLFFVLFSEGRFRDQAMLELRAQGIQSVFHYVPLHSSPRGQQVGGSAELPVTDDRSQRLLRLPFFHEMTAAQQSIVLRALERQVHLGRTSPSTFSGALTSC